MSCAAGGACPRVGPVPGEDCAPSWPSNPSLRTSPRGVASETATLTLGSLPGAVPCARLHARQVVWEWGLPELMETAELVVSELVTNGVRACEGLRGSRYRGRWRPGTPPVRLWLQSDRQRLLVQVWDGNDRMPHRQ